MREVCLPLQRLSVPAGLGSSKQQGQLRTCLDVAPYFMLTRRQAVSLIERQIEVVVSQWRAVCVEAEMSDVDRNLLRRRQLLNPYAFEGLENEPSLIRVAREFWNAK